MVIKKGLKKISIAESQLETPMVSPPMEVVIDNSPELTEMSFFQLNRNNLVQAVIFSEILGKPKGRAHFLKRSMR